MRWILLATLFFTAASGDKVGASADLTRFEARHTHAVELTPDGSRLLALNSDDARLSVFDVSNPTSAEPVLIAEIPVGLEPVSVRARSNTEAWVINELSDSVSVVDLIRGVTIATLVADDEPADVIFAAGKAFVSCARNNIIRVFDPASRTQTGEIALEGIFPRALAANEDGTLVYAAFLLSGNHTTTLSPALAPDPPPPTNPALPPAPKTGEIVSASDPRITYTVRELDVVEVDTETLAIRRSFTGLGTNLFDIAVQPGVGDLWVAATEARNLVRFEPALRGHPVDNLLSRVAISDGANATFDLNPGLDYSLFPNPARASALAQPMALVFSPGGDHLWLAAYGSDQVAKLSTDGSVLQRVNLRTNVGTGDIGTAQMRGPRSLALDAPRSRLFVFNKLSATITVVGTTSGVILAEFSVASFDPMPAQLRRGRKLFSDARLSSSGTVSCASCHPDADRDGVAWDLGDPGGEMFYTTGTNIGSPTIRTRELHPMKGPMVTQTLRGLAGMGDFHWRGDKRDLQSFNPTFNKLMGGTELAADDMDALVDYLKSLRHYPNPNRTLDDRLPELIRGGDPARGLAMFGSAKGNCFECHALPLTTNHNIDTPKEVGAPQPVKTASLRTAYQRVYFDGRAGRVARSGFGLGHSGLGFNLPFGHPYVLDSLDTLLEIADVTAFVLCVDTGTPPAVGRSLTITGENSDSEPVQQLLGTLEGQALGGKIAVVVRGIVAGTSQSFRYDPATDTYLADTAAVLPVTRTELLAALGATDAITVAGVPLSDAPRLGGDRNGNGVPDRDERKPDVTITAEPGGLVRLRWPSQHTDWCIEAAPAAAGPWTPRARAPQRLQTSFQYDELLPATSAFFYRLRRTW